MFYIFRGFVEFRGILSDIFLFLLIRLSCLAFYLTLLHDIATKKSNKA